MHVALNMHNKHTSRYKKQLVIFFLNFNHNFTQLFPRFQPTVGIFNSVYGKNLVNNRMNIVVFYGSDLKFRIPKSVN